MDESKDGENDLKNLQTKFYAFILFSFDKINSKNLQTKFYAFILFSFDKINSKNHEILRVYIYHKS
jgi:GTP cyclohydrolase III